MSASDAQSAATAERRKKAIALRIAGVDWQGIADQLGYASRGAACTDVTRALKKNRVEEAEQVEQLRYVESQRLDRLQAVVWGKSVKGDLRAVETALRIIDRRVKLYGLDATKSIEIALERRTDLESHLVADAVVAALDALGLTDEQRATALQAAQQKLTGQQDAASS